MFQRVQLPMWLRLLLVAALPPAVAFVGHSGGPQTRLTFATSSTIATSRLLQSKRLQHVQRHHHQEQRIRSISRIAPLLQSSSSSENLDDSLFTGNTTIATPSPTSDDTTTPNNTNNNNSNVVVKASKRKMLGFAIPALGIFLCNPLLSNIDNAFVGRTVGPQGLAALSPATVCTDQMLYLFSFLGRATTTLVSKAYAYNETTHQGNFTAARDAASPPLTVSLMAGILLTGLYAVATPSMLSALRVNPALHRQAATYIYWRGAIAWAALAQNIMLNVLLATRDAITPLKIVLLAALVNVVGDSLMCVWPFSMGCGGAAAATAFATLFSSAWMVQSLHRKKLLPRLAFPTRHQWWELLEFTGPLLAITFIRLLGQINMQQAAGRLGVNSLAAFQMGINLMFLFQLFGEPLSQLSQTRLPSLVAAAKTKTAQPQPQQPSEQAQDDSSRAATIRATLKSILVLATLTALPIGAAAGLTLGLGSGIFSSDPAVHALARNVAPALFCTVATGIFSITMDGALVASQDFVYMLGIAILSNFLQWKLLVSPWCSSVSAIFLSFTFRLAIYAVAGMIRVALGYGPLGKALRGTPKTKSKSTSTS